MCYVIIEDKQNFVCGHFFRFIKLARPLNTCQLNNCLSLGVQTSVNYVNHVPCQVCIRNGRSLPLTHSAGADSSARLVPRGYPQQPQNREQVQRPALEWNNIPVLSQQVLARTPVPAPAPVPAATPAPTPAAPEQPAHVKTGEAEQEAEAERKRILKEDAWLRNKLHTILEETMQSLIGGNLDGGDMDITDEMKEKAKSNAMNIVRQAINADITKDWIRPVRW